MRKCDLYIPAVLGMDQGQEIPLGGKHLQPGSRCLGDTAQRAVLAPSTGVHLVDGVRRHLGPVFSPCSRMKSGVYVKSQPWAMSGSRLVLC